jgi:hypothetical protein
VVFTVCSFNSTIVSSITVCICYFY